MTSDRRYRHVERVPELLRRWAEGETPTEIASALGVSRGWVYRGLKRNGVFTRERAELPPAEVMAARVGQLQARGYRLVEIERITGWPRKSIYRARRRVNAPPVYSRLSAEERRRIVRLWQEARRVRAVALRCGRHWKTTRDVLVRAGVYEPAAKGHPAAAGHPWRVDYRR